MNVSEVADKRIKSLLGWGTQVLRRVSSTPDLDARVLLGHCLQYSKEQLWMYADERVDRACVEHFQADVQARSRGKPVAYLTGSKEFFGLDFKVNRHTLIPRPETELLVEAALALMAGQQKSQWRVLELGTGSGAVAVSVVHVRPQTFVVATDIDHAALQVACGNAQGLLKEPASIHWLQTNWCAGVQGCFDLVLSNPPYVATEDPHVSAEVSNFEPKRALFAGVDGLQAIVCIVEEARALLAGGWLLLEHGAGQGASVRSVLQQTGYRQIVTLKDLAGLERVTQAYWSGQQV